MENISLMIKIGKQQAFFIDARKNKRERKSSFFEQKKKPEQLSSKKGTEPSKRIIMLANSCAAAATFGIHTQSNALVTSKIRARKTPKLIRSRVLSNAIAGKPVPPEVRKKIAHLCFTLIFFYLSLTAVLVEKATVVHFIFSRVSHSRRRFLFLFFVFFLVVSRCDCCQTDDCSHSLPLQFFSSSFSILLCTTNKNRINLRRFRSKSNSTKSSPSWQSCKRPSE